LDIEKFLEETAPLVDKAIEKYIPRKFSKDAVLFKVTPPMYSYTLEPMNKAIGPHLGHADRGGNGSSPFLDLDAWARKRILSRFLIPEVIHNGTLVIDDIEDSSECEEETLHLQDFPNGHRC
jgi:geranylgeranyl pyrophosphate synthase